MAEEMAHGGQQIYPLIHHLARIGRRYADAHGYLGPRLLIALKVLADYGPMTQHEFRKALDLDPSTVVGLLHELEEPGLVTRRRDPADRRRQIVSLSENGAAVFGGTHCTGIDDELLKTLAPSERATLHNLLVRAVGGIVPGGSWPS
jgi:DNA-binding MarR family transcriptional regulator